MLPEAAAWPSVLLLGLQLLLLAVFSFFSSFNYLYGIASLWRRPIRRVVPSGRKVAVVIVAFNEEHVLGGTLNACDALTYGNRLTVLADDSTDPQVVESLRNMARQRGCRPIEQQTFVQEVTDASGHIDTLPIEIWESPEFVFFHRPGNSGFKGGSLRKVHEYLGARGVDLMYLLDADWHPQPDAIERTLEVLEADAGAAFVQTKRISFPEQMNLFQKYVTLVEEGCYHVDFAGRQALGHPILFSGCCTLLRLDLVAAAGGFSAGHLTEDLDLTNRLWLKGLRGIFLEDVVNHGEVPFTYEDYRRQQERWASGSARAFKEFLWPILTTSRLSWLHKLSALRQNAYFTTTLLTGFAILLGITTVVWMMAAWNSYAVEYYLYLLGQARMPFVLLLYWCLLSNLVEPVLMIVFKKKTWRDLVHVPMMVWYAWSVIPTYVIGNVKGLAGTRQEWFRTPKFVRGHQGAAAAASPAFRILNIGLCAAAALFYFAEALVFGWFDEFALLIVPAFLLAAMKLDDR